MTTTTFDALSYFEKLKGAGVPEEQAKIQAETLRQAIYEQKNRQDLATRTDLKELELRLLKLQLGIGFAIIVIMAKGFGWLGF